MARLSLRRLAVTLLCGLAAAATPTPIAADVSAPFLAEDVEPRADVLIPSQRIRPWELADTTLLVRTGFDRDAPVRPGVWRTDGTPEGTVAVPLPGHEHVSRVLARTADRQRLYYTATDDEGRFSGLYLTDGTVDGTVQLVDSSFPGVNDGIYDPATDRLFFRQFDGSIGDFGADTLWLTDGTAPGTRRITPPGLPRRFRFADTAGGLVYLVSPGPSDVFTVSQLFRTDGTEAGTFEIAPEIGVAGGIATALGDRLVFLQAGPMGEELWATTGAPGSAVPLFGPNGSFGIELVRSGNLVYWFAAAQLIRTDGTPAGTELLAEIPPRGNGSRPFFREPMPLGNGSILFVGYTEATGYEPWLSDGTVAGTGLLADVCPGSCSSEPRMLAGFPAGGYFTADDGITGREVYAARRASVEQLTDLCPGPCSPEYREGDAHGDAAAFFADDGVGGWELYFARGLAAPVRVSDFLLDEAVGHAFDFFPETLTETGFYFHALTADGPAFLRADGTVGGIFSLVPPVNAFAPANSYPSGFSDYLGDLIFTAYDVETGLSLYRKQGDLPARRLGPLARGLRAPDGPQPGHLTRIAGNRVFALTHDGEPPYDFTRVHASADGTFGVLRLAEGLSFDDAWVAAERLFFIHRGDTPELWVSDGTEAGTRAFRTGLGSTVATPLGGLLLYEAGGALRLTDGTPGAGNETWLDLGALGLSGVGHLVPIDDDLFFTARRAGFDGLEMYYSDGTLAGTRRVSPADTAIQDVLGLLGDRVVYTVNTPPAVLLASSDPGAGVALPVVVGDEPSSAVLGDEMWIGTGTGRIVRLDGNPNHTEIYDTGLGQPWSVHAVPGHVLLLGGDRLLVTDGAPGAPAPLGTFEDLGTEVEAVADRAYFAADGSLPEDGGFELWAVALDGITPPPPPPPADELPPPHGLRAEGRPHGIEVKWSVSTTEPTRFVIQAQGWTTDSPWETVAEVPVGVQRVLLDRGDLPANGPFLDGRPVKLRVRAENDVTVSPWSDAVSATPLTFGPRCDPAAADALCLQDDRFAVRVFWRDQRNNTHGLGTPDPFDFSNDSGGFWFFDEDNIELVVKVLDARVINDRFWTFFGALSDVEYWVVVSDTEDQANVTYSNPPGEICGQADNFAFPRTFLRGRALPEPSGGLGYADRRRPGTVDRGGAGCVPDGDTLCLTPDRYRVTVTWRDQRSGDTGVGHAIPGTEDSGYFWFFDPENVELVVKVLDGTPVNGFRWVFYGALTDVEYTLTVTDTETGETQQYVNPPGNICGGADVRAFGEVP